MHGHHCSGRRGNRDCLQFENLSQPYCHNLEHSWCASADTRFNFEGFIFIFFSPLTKWNFLLSKVENSFPKNSLWVVHCFKKLCTRTFVLSKQCPRLMLFNTGNTHWHWGEGGNCWAKFPNSGFFPSFGDCWTELGQQEEVQVFSTPVPDGSTGILLCAPLQGGTGFPTNIYGCPTLFTGPWYLQGGGGSYLQPWLPFWSFTN